MLIISKPFIAVSAHFTDTVISRHFDLMLSAKIHLQPRLLRSFKHTKSPTSLTSSSLKAADLCHQDLMPSSLRNKKGFRAFFFFFSCEPNYKMHTLNCQHHLFVFLKLLESSEAFFFLLPPSSFNQNLLIRTSFLKTQKKSLKQTLLTLPEINKLLRLEAAGPETPPPPAKLPTHFSVLTGSQDGKKTPDTRRLNRRRCTYL